MMMNHAVVEEVASRRHQVARQTSRRALLPVEEVACRRQHVARHASSAHHVLEGVAHSPTQQNALSHFAIASH